MESLTATKANVEAALLASRTDVAHLNSLLTTLQQEKSVMEQRATEADQAEEEVERLKGKLEILEKDTEALRDVINDMKKEHSLLAARANTADRLKLQTQEDAQRIAELDAERSGMSQRLDEVYFCAS